MIQQESELVCGICLNPVEEVHKIQHNDDSCRCTKKRTYCRECILGWYAVMRRVACPVCKEFNRNQLTQCITEENMVYMVDFMIKFYQSGGEINNSTYHNGSNDLRLVDDQFDDQIDNHDDPMLIIEFSDIRDLIQEQIQVFYMSVKTSFTTNITRIKNYIIKNILHGVSDRMNYF